MMPTGQHWAMNHASALASDRNLKRLHQGDTLAECLTRYALCYVPLLVRTVVYETILPTRLG